MKYKKLIINALIYTILPKISFIGSLIVTPLVSPFLKLEDFGIYALIIAYLNIFQILIILGQNIVLQNSFFTRGKNFHLIWGRSFGIMITAGAISAIIISIIIALTMSTMLNTALLPVCLMVSFFLIFSPIETIALNYYVLNEKPLPYTICSTIIGFVTVFLNLFTIKFLRLGYLGWIIIMPVTIIITYAYHFRRLFIKEKLYPVFRIKASFLKTALKIGAPLIPHQLSLYILGTSDRLLLEYYAVPTRQIGFYSQGYNLGAYANILVNGVFQAIARQLQENFRGQEEKNILAVRRTIIVVPIIINVILFIGALWMKEIFQFLYRKPELQQAYTVAIVIICSYMFWPIYTFFTYPLSIKGKTFSIAKISILAAVVNLIGNIIFIRVWGVWAAVGTTYIAYMIFGFAGLFNKENRKELNRYINITKACLAIVLTSVCLFFIVYLSKDSGFFSKFTITILTLTLIAAGYTLKQYFFKRI